MERHLFGTDGIRTTFGKEPLTPNSLIKLGKAIGVWASKKYGIAKIALAHDTRFSNSLCKAALKTGLLQQPIFIDDYTVLPTPLLFHLVQEKKYDVGIMLTASHNQAKDNGIKLFTKHGGKLTIDDEQLITNAFFQNSLPFSVNQLGKEQQGTTNHTWYIKLLKNYFEKNFLKGVKVVVDCAHGAFFTLAPTVFKHFGATVITINNKPDGHNINKQCGSIYPESLQEKILEKDADFGCAFDGDGDRLTFVNKNGNIKMGDDLLALLATHPLYKSDTGIVGTIMSNQGLAHHFAQHNKKFLRTPVGDKYITAMLKEKNLLLGGEPSGHIMLRDFSETSDALFTALRVLQTALISNNKTLKSFKKFPHILINIPVIQKKDLSTPAMVSLLNKTELKLPQGRVIVRYSGTEPLLRVMIEDVDFDLAKKVGATLVKQLSTYLTKECL